MCGCGGMCTHTHSKIRLLGRAGFWVGVRSLHVVLQRLGDKEVMADWRIQGWTPLPQRRRRHTSTPTIKIFCWNVLVVGSL